MGSFQESGIKGDEGNGYRYKGVPWRDLCVDRTGSWLWKWLYKSTHVLKLHGNTHTPLHKISTFLVDKTRINSVDGTNINSWFWYCTSVLDNVTIEGKLVEEYMVHFLYHLQLPVNIQLFQYKKYIDI